MFESTIEFPFKSVLSFSGLIDLWRQLLSSGGNVETGIMKAVEEELQNKPEFTEPITDLTVLEKNRGLVDMLLNIVFPPGF